jgi:hypothetical protein
MKRPWFVTYFLCIVLWQVFAILAYWVLWFAAPDVVQTFPPQSPEYPSYVVFEQAFILADALLVFSAIIGITGLWRKRPWGYFVLMLNAGGLLYLGSMDLLYDLEHSVFVPMSTGGAVELAIVLMVWLLGSFNIWLFWTKRAYLFLYDSDTEFVGRKSATNIKSPGL